jgi:hypothetical protein
MVLATSLLVACSAGGAAASAKAETDASPSSIEPAGGTPAPTAAVPTPSAAPSAAADVESMYSGTFEVSGTIKFTVSADGSQVIAFAAEFPPCGIPGGTVSMNSDNGYVAVPVPIDSGAFTFGVSPSYTGTGQLLPNEEAAGTVIDPGNPDAFNEACRVPTVLKWTAAIVR